MPTTMIRRLTARDARLSSFRLYDLLVHIFVVILLISNLVGQKICVVPFISIYGHHPRVSGAQLLFPISYIFGDIFTEVYGYGAARRAIWIAFVGRAPLGTMINLIISGYLFKVLYEVLATPITYWVVNNLKRIEGADVYDRGTNFNPFARSREIISEAG